MPLGCPRDARSGPNSKRSRATIAQRGPYRQESAAAPGYRDHDRYDAPFPGYTDRSRFEFELALSDDTFWATARSRFSRGEGYGSLGLLINDDKDVLLAAHLLRFARPNVDLPLEVGVGFGAYAGFPDEPDDQQAYALTLSATAAYFFETAYPTSLSALASVAPDVTTFDNGEDLLDILVRLEMEVGRHATAFVGYRFLEIDFENGSEVEFDDRIHLGVRLGL